MSQQKGFIRQQARQTEGNKFSSTGTVPLHVFCFFYSLKGEEGSFLLWSWRSMMKMAGSGSASVFGSASGSESGSGSIRQRHGSAHTKMSWIRNTDTEYRRPSALVIPGVVNSPYPNFSTRSTSKNFAWLTLVCGSWTEFLHMRPAIFFLGYTVVSGIAHARIRPWVIANSKPKQQRIQHYIRDLWWTYLYQKIKKSVSLYKIFNRKFTFDKNAGNA